MCQNPCKYSKIQTNLYGRKYARNLTCVQTLEFFDGFGHIICWIMCKTAGSVGAGGRWAVASVGDGVNCKICKNQSICEKTCKDDEGGVSYLDFKGIWRF